MSMQVAELHFRSAPKYDSQTIVARVEELIQSGIELPGDCDEQGMLLFFHNNYSVQYKDGSLPAQTTVLATDKAPDPDAYMSRVQQSWSCEDADQRLAECSHSCVVTEMLARALEPVDRLRLFHGVLQAVVEIAEPAAISFLHSHQVVAPERYLESCSQDPIMRTGSLNVRFYNVSNSEGDMIMDTRGLEEVGLHDLQCHYHGLDPDEVSRVLYNTALYIFENGAVIESGQTVSGVGPDSQWLCQFENSMLEPKREVLDLNPGDSFAAGQRN